MAQYEALAVLVEKHREELARQVVKKLSLEDPAQAKTTEERLVRGVAFGIDYIARYLRTGDVTEWVGVVKQASQWQLQEGTSVNKLIATTEAVVEGIEKLIEQEWPGSANVSTRNLYKTRLKGIKMVTRVTQQGSAFIPK